MNLRELEAAIEAGDSLGAFEILPSGEIERKRNDDNALSIALYESGEHIAQFFMFSHLPVMLQDVSRSFALLAVTVIKTISKNPERTVALRKLLEAKDAAVRAALAKP